MTLGRAITCDRAGNVFVAGGFSLTAGFSGTNLISTALLDMFLVKYDANGNRIWARRAGTSVAPPSNGPYNYEGYALAADRDGNVLVSGYFQSRASFGTNVLTAVLTNQPDVFLAKYDTSGSVLWANPRAARWPISAERWPRIGVATPISPVHSWARRSSIPPPPAVLARRTCSWPCMTRRAGWSRCGVPAAWARTRTGSGRGWTRQRDYWRGPFGAGGIWHRPAGLCRREGGFRHEGLLLQPGCCAPHHQPASRCQHRPGLKCGARCSR